ncbi:related to 4-coumarate--CoA ligase [Cephalotrichum gorgonifer]|uniref:Related to 4-coumarate--CoA ligase n=1 Tax=Cephalotrichum gorgonifer TaxID=2041049 RepID=A0AAE8MT60_9PEZI|nr:related to 4-coumarate--CoA ligase [Cephalotrichum gorgonifer]
MAGAETKQVAISGFTPKEFPAHNIFDWVTGDSFQRQEFLPASHRVPPIEGSRPIFIDHKSGRALTQSQIQSDSLALAAGLQSLGLSPTDIHTLPPTATCPRPEIAPVVLIQLPNSLPFSPIALGTFASGLTATLVSPALTGSEISWILQNARPRVIITSTTCLAAMREAIRLQEDAAYFASVPVFTVDVANGTYPLPEAQKQKHAGSAADPRPWTDLLTLAPPLARAVQLPGAHASNRTAVILWSSGTSGRSKGVLISHNALNFSVGSIWHDADYARPGTRQVWLGYVPFYHVFGLCNILLLSTCIGATVHVMSSFNLEAVLQAVPRFGVTYFHMAPPVAVMLSKAAVVEKYAARDASGKNAFSTVVAGVTGGAPLGHDIVVQVYKRLGFRVKMGYGLSEACSTTVQHGIDEASMHAHAGDSGAPHWGVEVMIAPRDQTYPSPGPLKPAPINTEGEILIRCPGIMSSYLPIGGVTTSAPDMSVTSEALTPEGWFRTGDVGTLDAAGHLRITDRLKELIKVRAFQVAPAELEAILSSDEEVADAGVVGVYDKDEATEWPRAFVVSRKERSETELRELAARLKTLVEGKTARYKWLVGGVVFVEQIPKSPSGKILRRVMKDGGVKGFEVKLYEKKKRDEKKRDSKL